MKRLLTFADSAVLVEQLNWMRRNSRFALTASVLGVWVVVLTSSMSRVSWLLGGVYTVSAFATGISFQRTIFSPRNLQWQALQIVLFMTSLGCALAGLGAWVMLTQSPESVLIYVVVASGIVAGALGFSSVYFPVFLGFMLPTLLTVWGLAGFLYDQAQLWQAMFWGAPILMSAYWYFGLNAHHTSVSSIELRFSNQKLLAEFEVLYVKEQDARHQVEMAHQAKSKFLAAASHDLRQPVQAIGLFLSALNRDTLPSKELDILKSTDSALQACCDMLDALLDFSRIEAGILNVQNVSFALQPMLYRVYEEFGKQADQRDLVLRLRDTQAWVFADPMLLEMALRNLLTNALRYTERGGVLIGVRERGKEVVIEVWDTGIGIDESDQASIFQEFHQLGNPERDHRKGLGLGLAIVQGLMQVMDARVSLHSRLGRGSVFRLHLPYASQAQHQLEVLPLPNAEVLSLRGVRVLVLDDNVMVLSALSAILQKLEIEYRLAETIGEALLCTDDWQPDVLLTDYRLRGVHTGGDAIRLIQQKLNRKLPAIIITGDTEPTRLRDARRMGAMLLHKPVSLDRLAEALSLAIDFDSGYWRMTNQPKAASEASV